MIIHEKYDKIGYNPDGRRCGEAHDVIGEWKKWMPSSNSIFNKITNAEVYSGNKKVVKNVKEGIGYIINRPEFLVELADRATKLGAIIKTNHKINSIKNAYLHLIYHSIIIMLNNSLKIVKV